MTEEKSSQTDDNSNQDKEKPTIGRGAFSIAEFGQRNDVSRTFTYEEIRSGRLKARKAGRRTLITPAAEREWHESLPMAGAK